MKPLAINAQCAEWAMVRAWVETRREELLDDLGSLTVTEQQRRDAAVRRDELALLLDAPGDALRASQARYDANPGQRATY